MGVPHNNVGQRMRGVLIGTCNKFRVFHGSIINNKTVSPVLPQWCPHSVLSWEDLHGSYIKSQRIHFKKEIYNLEYKCNDNVPSWDQIWMFGTIWAQKETSMKRRESRKVTSMTFIKKYVNNWQMKDSVDFIATNL